MKILKNKNIKYKKVIIIATSLLILFVACFYIYFTIKQNSTTDNSTKVENTSTTSESVTNGSSNNTVEKTNDNSTINTSSEVSLVIVDASQYTDIFEVRVYAADVVENGTCTYSFTSGINTVTKTTGATAGSSTSSCSAMDISISELSASNDWTLKITYMSGSGNYNGEITKDISIK